MITKVSSLLIDYLHMGRGHVISYFRSPPSHYLGFVTSGKAPIVIIPGIMEQWGMVKKLSDTLSLIGHPVYIVPSLKNNLATIPSCATAVMDVINTNNLQGVILIGHSKGGLIGKYMLSFMNEKNQIRHLFAIATPFSGSSVARIVSHAAFRELLPESNIVQLLSNKRSVNSKITSMYPVFDNHILKKNASTLIHAKNIQVHVHGHHTILFDKGFISRVVFEIETDRV